MSSLTLPQLAQQLGLTSEQLLTRIEQAKQQLPPPKRAGDAQPIASDRAALLNRYAGTLPNVNESYMPIRGTQDQQKAIDIDAYLKFIQSDQSSNEFNAFAAALPSASKTRQSDATAKNNSAVPPEKPKSLPTKQEQNKKSA